MAAEWVAALDIGTTKVCALVAEVGPEGRHQIVGYGEAPSRGVRRGVVVDLPVTEAAIREAVAMAGTAAGVEIRSVVAGISGEHVHGVNSRGILAVTHPDRVIQREDVARVLESARQVVLPPDRELLHVIARGYSLDGQQGIRNPVGMCGTRLEVETHVVTGAAALIRNLHRAIESAGIDVEEFVLQPVAAGEAVLLEAERDLGVALVDIGGGTSDIAIFRSGAVAFTAVVPVGGDLVTRDIASGLRCEAEEAERLKRSFATARESSASEATIPYLELARDETVEVGGRYLAAIVEARARELLELTRAEVRRAGGGDHLPGGVVLTGGGAQLRDLERLAEEVLELRTRIGSPRVAGGLSETLMKPPYATAVGLVRFAVGRLSGSRRRGGTVPAIRSAASRFWRDFWGR